MDLFFIGTALGILINQQSFQQFVWVDICAVSNPNQRLN